MAEEYSARMSEQVRTSGVDLAFVTTRTHNQVIKNNQEDLPISQNASSVRGTYHVLRDSTTVTDTKKDSLSTYKSGNIRSIQWDMGGHLTPQLAIRTEDDGTTSLYSHMLQSWNMFRNHSFGSKIDGKNYDTTETKDTPLGLVGTGYKARPIQRVYGTWVANAPKFAYGPTRDSRVKLLDANGDDASVAGSTAAVKGVIMHGTDSHLPVSEPDDMADGTLLDVTAPATQGHLFVKGVGTLTFVPHDPTQVGLVSLGQRCKMGVEFEIPGEDSSFTSAVLSRDTDGRLQKSGGASAPTLHNTHGDSSIDNMIGLERFYKHSLANLPTGYTHDSVTARDNCLYAGAPGVVAFFANDEDVENLADTYIGGLGIPFVDGQNLPVFSAQPWVSRKGWVDVIPDDDKFFLGNTFETFGSAAPQLVSGSDLTQATPLLLKLDYQEPAASNMYAPRKDTDNFTSFVQIDSVLRLQPDGLLISSV